MSQGTNVFNRLESNVRSYCRDFPWVLARAKDSYIYDESGRRWLDFFCSAGVLSYGHNDVDMKLALNNYMLEDGIVSSLDFHTSKKHEFLESFNHNILAPRKLDYKVQFCGPTGASSVEAAIRLAKKYTGREGVLALTKSFHGMSLGASSISHSISKTPKFDNRFLSINDENVVEALARIKKESLPALVIVEIVQCEGGINIAQNEWLHNLYGWAKDNGVLFCVDDIQAGCGRTGKFFSFEHYGIKPDLVTVSKSISGFGLPMSLLLLDKKIDVWDSGEYNGTFRGFSYAFITSKIMIEKYWMNPLFEEELSGKSNLISVELDNIVERFDGLIREVRQLGMVVGIEFCDADLASSVRDNCFDYGVVVECCGEGRVLKLLPPITATSHELREGCALVGRAIKKAVTPLKPVEI